MWTIAYRHRRDRTPYEARRDAAVAAFAKSWRKDK
jgi:hypothetical protein